MPKHQVRVRHGKRYTAPEFRPYVTALGQLSLAWNDLQESLGALFWTMMSPRPLVGAFVHREPLFVWYAIRSDRSQREMLKAAVNHLTIDWERPLLVVETNWIIDRANELENWRNDAIHSPLFFAEGLGAISDKSGIKSYANGIKPAYWQFNPRAINLAKRDDLLAEFRFCRDTAITLADYAHLIDLALINYPTRSWPERPKLPNRKPRKTPPSQPSNFTQNEALRRSLIAPGAPQGAWRRSFVGIVDALAA
jgi:hypothetical protein